MDLPKDFKEFIECLNANGVEYVIVGGYAQAFHGRPRFTGDLDVLVRPGPENAARLEAALRSFGFAGSGLSAADFLSEERVVQLGVPPCRIDILTSLTGCTFDEVWAGRIPARLGGVPVNFIGREEYVRNKRAVGRPQDLADLDALG